MDINECQYWDQSVHVIEYCFNIICLVPIPCCERDDFYHSFDVYYIMFVYPIISMSLLECLCVSLVVLIFTISDVCGRISNYDNLWDCTRLFIGSLLRCPGWIFIILYVYSYFEYLIVRIEICVFHHVRYQNFCWDESWVMNDQRNDWNVTAWCEHWQKG